MEIRVIAERWKEAGAKWGKVKIGKELYLMAELARDPEMFHSVFTAIDKTLYISIYEHFIMVLRTAPGDRLNSFMHSKNLA